MNSPLATHGRHHFVNLPILSFLSLSSRAKCMWSAFAVPGRAAGSVDKVERDQPLIALSCARTLYGVGQYVPLERRLMDLASSRLLYRRYHTSGKPWPTFQVCRAVHHARACASIIKITPRAALVRRQTDPASDQPVLSRRSCSVSNDARPSPTGQQSQHACSARGSRYPVIATALAWAEGLGGEGGDITLPRPCTDC